MKWGNRHKLSNRTRNSSLGNDGAKPKLCTISILRLPEAHEKAEEGRKRTDEASRDHVMPSLLNMYDSVLKATGFTRLDIQTSVYKRDDDVP
jgi:hypothetical protein